MPNDPSLDTALLNFCTSVQASASASGTERPSAQPRCSPADLQWLRAAVASIEPPERQIRRLLHTMDAADTPDPDRLVALEELSDLVEDLNWAEEFALMDGPARTLRWLRATPNPRVRRGAALVMAHASQLHAAVQQRFEAAAWEDVLVPLLQQESDPDARAALLHSCSCLCRDYAPNARRFVTAGGADVVAELLDARGADEKTTRRALFLLAYLAEVGVVEADAGWAKRVCEQAESPETETQRAAARTLTAMMRQNPTLVQSALRAHAAEVMASWRNTLFDEDDSRRLLVELLYAEGHGG